MGTRIRLWDADIELTEGARPDLLGMENDLMIDARLDPDVAESFRPIIKEERIEGKTAKESSTPNVKEEKIEGKIAKETRTGQTTFSPPPPGAEGAPPLIKCKEEQNTVEKEQGSGSGGQASRQSSLRLTVIGKGGEKVCVNVPLEGSPGLWRRVAREFGTQAGIADWTRIRLWDADIELTEGARPDLLGMENDLMIDARLDPDAAESFRPIIKEERIGGKTAKESSRPIIKEEKVEGKIAKESSMPIVGGQAS